MGKVLNRLAFYLALICGGLVVIFSTNLFKDLFFDWFSIHPLKIVFYITMLNLFIGLAGFAGVSDWKGALRSIFSVGFSLCLWVFLAYIFFVGNIAN